MRTRLVAAVTALLMMLAVPAWAVSTGVQPAGCATSLYGVRSYASGHVDHQMWNTGFTGYIARTYLNGASMKVRKSASGWYSGWYQVDASGSLSASGTYDYCTGIN